MNSELESTFIVHKVILKASRFRHWIAIMKTMCSCPCLDSPSRLLEMKKLDFDKTLLEAVDHALLAFGESPREAIYYHLNESFKLQREDIPEDTDRFSHALNTIFGPGAEVIEKLIIKNLYNRLNLNFEEKSSFEIADYIKQARELAKPEQPLEVRKLKGRRKLP